MTDILRAAKRLHQAYDRAQMARHRLMVPRNWQALPPDCQQEFIDITQHVLDGQIVYKGRVIPLWVKTLINQ